jgi:hypothetical protein
MPQLKLTADILSAAVIGFEVQKFAIERKIAEIRLLVEGGRSEPGTPSGTGKPRKKRSAAVRRKMALAQRARYARLRQSSEPTQAMAAKPRKRKLSAAGRRAIIAATKKRWAAVKAAKQAEPAVANNAGRKKAASAKGLKKA